MPSDASSRTWPLPWGTRTYLMGVINVTPDSFSGDGVLYAPGAAGARAQTLLANGADLLDVGAESTRPGFQPVPANQEIARLLPVLTALSHTCDSLISVDTRKAAVADAALCHGAQIVNDVSGLADPEMIEVVAGHRAGLIVVHNGETDSALDLVHEVMRDLAQLIERAGAAGVSHQEIIADPGLGMGKDWRANLELIRRLPEFRELGVPIMIGPSRKGMIGRVLGVTAGDRIEGTAALVTLGVAGGADMVRVHDLPAMKRVALMADALVR